MTAHPTRTPLAVGLLVDSLRVPAWVARIVREIQAGDYAEITAVVIDRPRAAAAAPFRKRIPARTAIDGLLFSAFRLLDRLVFRAPDNPFRRIDIEADLQAARTIAVAPRTSGPAAWLDGADAARIRRLELDVLLCLGSRRPAPDGPGAARYGVWSYRHGQERAGGGGHGLFWDLYDDRSVSSVALHVDGPGGSGGTRVVRQTVGSIVPWSYTRGVHSLYWESSAFAPQRLRRLFEEGFPAIEGRSADRERPARDGRRPTNREMLRFLPRHMGLLARRAGQRCFRRERWFLVVNSGPRLGALAAPAAAAMKAYRPPRGRFWADPFPVVAGGRVWVFFEDYCFTSGKAVISCAPVSAAGVLGDVSTVVDSGYHLSYPFILEQEGDLYMVPDTWDEQRVELWRCRKFPDDWVRERILLDGVRMSDPTIHPRDGRLWLFGAMSEARERANDELHVYVADALDGAWRPHPANPVVSDCRRARPAGRMFSLGGELLRPAQDCARQYGGAVVINRVDELNERAYAETPVGRIDGRRLGGDASHTINYAGGLEFLDVRETVRKWT